MNKLDCVKLAIIQATSDERVCDKLVYEIGLYEVSDPLKAVSDILAADWAICEHDYIAYGGGNDWAVVLINGNATVTNDRDEIAAIRVHDCGKHNYGHICDNLSAISEDVFVPNPNRDQFYADYCRMFGDTARADYENSLNAGVYAEACLSEGNNVVVDDRGNVYSVDADELANNSWLLRYIGNRNEED